MWAVKSTEKLETSYSERSYDSGQASATHPIHMIRFIIEMESRLIPQNVMKPSTPISMEMMEKATQREQTGLGMKMRETTIMTPAAMATHWIVVGRTTRN